MLLCCPPWSKLDYAKKGERTHEGLGTADRIRQSLAAEY